MFSICDAHCHLESMKGYLPASQPDFLHITCGYSLKSSMENFEIAQKHENVFCCLGIAPQEAMKFSNVKEEVQKAEEFIVACSRPAPSNLVAIGEIGLDFHWAKTFEEKEKQTECFLSMLSLARNLSLPVVIHSRNSMDEVIDVLAQQLPKKIMMHCYGGTVEHTKKLLELGAIFSMPPLRSKDRKKVIKLAGANRIVCETDAPYIGKTPLAVQESVKMVSDALGITEKEAQERTKKNAMEFFSIRG